MLEHDLTAGLAVPVEVLVKELSREEGGGTDLIWNLPSQLVIGGSRDRELRESAEVLDGMVEALMRSVAGEQVKGL